MLQDIFEAVNVGDNKLLNSIYYLENKYLHTTINSFFFMKTTTLFLSIQYSLFVYIFEKCYL